MVRYSTLTFGLHVWRHLVDLDGKAVRARERVGVANNECSGNLVLE